MLVGTTWPQPAFAATASRVSEEAYQHSKKEGVQIVPADVPDPYEISPNPVQQFMRRVVFAVTELEKELTWLPISTLPSGLKRL